MCLLACSLACLLARACLAELYICFLQLEGQGLLPFTLDKQNLLLASAITIANQQGLPLLNFNVSSWKAAPAAASTGNRQGRPRDFQTTCPDFAHLPDRYTHTLARSAACWDPLSP